MYRIGIDLGGTFIKGGVIGEASEIIYKDKVPTPEGHEPDKVIEAISELITILKKSVKDKDCVGIGIGSPGITDNEAGIVRYSNNFNWNEPVELVKEISRYHSEPVYLANDAKCAALGEWVYGGCDKSKSTILITLGTGLGSGVIINGKIFASEVTGSVEMGHMTIKEGGRKCTCGNRGCLEAYASVTGLIKDGTKAAWDHKHSRLHKILKKEKALSGLSITDAARDGDVTAIKVIDKYSEHLGAGIVGIINVFRPDVIYIGGGLSDSFDLFERTIKDKASTMCFGGDKAKLPVIMKAQCGNDAGIIGAAYLANASN